jgi:tetratricopeptide (TPR) repeat protein
MAKTLFRAWMMQGQLDELISWLDRALGVPDTTQPGVRALGLHTLGDALFMTDHLDRAHTTLTESLDLFRAIGDESGEAHVLNELGGVHWSLGDHDDAIALREQALEIYRRQGDNAGVARSLHLIGEDLRDVGEFERGAALLEEAMKIDSDIGDLYSAATSAHSLGDLALDQGDLIDATRRYRYALETVVGIDDERGQAYCLAGLAAVSALKGERRGAGRLWEIAESAETRLGQRFLAVERQRYERILTPLYADPEFQAGRRDAQGLTLAEGVANALAEADSTAASQP